MSLDDLDDNMTANYTALGDETTVDLDPETRNELAMLQAAMGTDTDELLRRGIHALFQQAVQSGDLDFHLRNGYDVTYDEYLAGTTYEEMTGGDQYPERDEDRRYNM
ncbi:hypothetical protein B4589_006215 [Halolamina sp. CBA1230]|uniref:hypothetical protein n=1 Tax=Halolamina sp. CBA1230 TaxID=1853690 RepID=UPI0009A20930|nr:hypothetical protein [Halolamina sp. CBA1230]QKY19992.1 hypothetical protein B4589_006215 [Halolamina sp. CBA1230]